jgi:YVTN family beta-propeller protein
VTTVTVGKNPFDLAITGSGAKAYVTNAGSNSVSVINTASNTGTPNLALSPGTQTGDNSYGYNFGPVSGSGSGTQTFTVSNTGTGGTQTLALVVTASSSSGGSFTISNDTCTGGQLAPNWTCTFLVNAALSCLESGVIAAIGEMSVTGQSTDVHYIDLTLAVVCQ